MLTKADHMETIQAAREFKQLLDETLLADSRHVNPTPFESEIIYTGGKISRLLDRLIGMYEN